MARVVMTKSEISKFKVLCVAAFSVAADSPDKFFNPNADPSAPFYPGPKLF